MKLLKKLTTTPGIPGREHRVRQVILEQIDGLFEDVRVDAMGSIIAVKKPTRSSPKPLRVMLAAHMDQIGFMVKHIDDKGFLRINSVGGFDTRNLFARMCTICPDVRNPDNDLKGVLNPGGKPIHISDPQERKKIPEVNELTVDLGLPLEQVRERVKIGDMVVLDAPAQKVGETFVSQCLDNRVACWIAIRAIEKLRSHNCEIHCVFTVQEEVGIRGAETSAFSVKPDIGIGIDTTLCVDTPGVPEDMRTTKQGHGAALTVMDSSTISDLDLLENFESIAKEKEIPYQRSILTRGGTDSASIQRAGPGARVLTLSCPTRYIHTVTEMVHLNDLNACCSLLTAYLSRAKQESNPS
ncbi:MAG: Putative aminopeptidase YsdC [Candidatus Moanabacter tarae]|uniref:Aminopeptidase YsdC n=1 Tax=Candidatus Moanibacter tarae TaxID=2200854 RepID=A0A2Z4AC94_9BACT|nr:MAG: Putative aminopeptidase YsdC [Candidatus Moanabacter tarae]|tara:strand:+ start:7011 stop:8072 length:1062 start_codon:yes stop_codon:yes gene_type:complete